MSVKEMYMGREMTGTTTLAESVYNEMGGDTPLITESQTVKGAVNELKTIEGTEAYDNTATYAVGDYCIYNSTRYKCITAVTTAEDFDSTKWSATTTNNDISELNSSLENIISSLENVPQIIFINYTLNNSGAVTANTPLLVNISSLTGGKITNANQIKGISLVTAGGSGGYDYGMRIIADGANFRINPSMSQSSVIVKFGVLY